MRTSPLLFTIFFCCIFLLTVGIPFYWQDYIQIWFLSNEWSYSLLGAGLEFYFRPLENLTYFIFFQLFGVESLPFRIGKALITASVALFIYFFVKKNTEQTNIAVFASLFYLTAAPLLQSVMLIYDFEIVTQFFLLAATYFFFSVLEREKPIKEVFFFTFFVLLALLTKESAKVFVGVCLIFLFLTCFRNYKKIKYFVLPLLFLLLFALKAAVLLGLESPSSLPFLIAFFRIHFNVYNLITITEYIIKLSFWIFFAGFLLISFSSGRKEKLKKMFETKRDSFVFFGLWFLITFFLTIAVPIVETRYFLVFFLPFVLFLFIIIGNLYQEVKKETKKRLLLIFWFLIILTIIINAGISFKYRYGFGNFFIALEKMYTYTEENYINSTFIYHDTSGHWHVGIANNNSYHGYNQDFLDTFSITDLQKLYFIDPYGSLNISEKRSAMLQKTIVKGPHCMMLYQWREEEHEIYNRDIQKTKEQQKEIIIFSNPVNISFCSITLETQFFFPQNIVITVIGENENATTIIQPPIGKYKSCDYLCPVLGNSSITAIEIKTRQSKINTLTHAEMQIRG